MECEVCHGTDPRCEDGKPTWEERLFDFVHKAEGYEDWKEFIQQEIDKAKEEGRQEKAKEIHHNWLSEHTKVYHKAQRDLVEAILEDVDKLHHKFWDNWLNDEGESMNELMESLRAKYLNK